MTVAVLHPHPRQLDSSAADARTTFGTAARGENGVLEVHTGDCILRAEVSPSCLLTPQVGDRVLVAYQGDEAYILAVLQSEATQVCVEVGGNLSIRAAGNLELVGAQGVNLEAPSGTTTVRAERIRAEAEDTEVGFGTLRLLGQAVSAKVKQVRVVAEAYDTIASRIFQRAVHFLRRTDEHDLVESRTMDRRCEGLMHLHGENVVATAEQLTKINAAQVHVG